MFAFWPLGREKMYMYFDNISVEKKILNKSIRSGDLFNVTLDWVTITLFTFNSCVLSSNTTKTLPVVSTDKSCDFRFPGY